MRFLYEFENFKRKTNTQQEKNKIHYFILPKFYPKISTLSLSSD